MSDSNDTDSQMSFDMSPAPRVDTSYLFTEMTPPQTQQGDSGQEIIPAERLSRGRLFSRLTKGLSLSDFGLPDFIYRADLIPDNLFELNPHKRNDILESAILPITWEHGYPAIDDSTPIWEKLPGESQSAYHIFLDCLETPEKTRGENPVRMIPLLAMKHEMKYRELSDLSHIYYWTLRFRAYDLFILACHQKQREQRILTIEGKHFTQADNYLNKLDQVINARLDYTLSQLSLGDEDAAAIHDDLKLKDLVDMVDKLTKIQRVSVGLPANGASNETVVGGKNQTIEDSFKEINTHASPTKNKDNRSQQMDNLLASPEDLAAAQDLIIRSNTNR